MQYVLLIYLLFSILVTFFTTRILEKRNIIVKGSNFKKDKIEFETKIFVVFNLIGALVYVICFGIYIISIMLLIAIISLIYQIYNINKFNKETKDKEMLILKNKSLLSFAVREIYLVDEFIYTKNKLPFSFKKYDRNFSYELIHQEEGEYMLQVFFMRKKIKKYHLSSKKNLKTQKTFE